MVSEPAHSTENNSRLRRCFYFAVFTMRCVYVAIFLLGVYYPVDSQPFIPKQDETPGIFPNKLNHELDDPEKFIVFRDLGQRVDEVGRAHLQVPVNVTHVLRKIDFHINLSMALLEKPLSQQAEVLNRFRLHTLLDLEQQLLPLVSLHTSVENHRISKRQLEILFGIGAAAFGIYTAYEMAAITGRLDSIGHVQTALVHKVDEFALVLSDQGRRVNELQHTQAALAVTYADFAHEVMATQLHDASIMALTIQTLTIVRVAQAVMAGKFPIGIIKQEVMQQTIRALADRAATQDYVLLAKTQADLYASKTSYLSHEDGFTIVAHIGMARPRDFFDVHQYIPVPYKVSDSSFLTFRPEHDVIAISRDKKQFRTMPFADLNRCEITGRTYLCDHGTISRQVNKDEPETNCVFNLLAQDYEGVQRNCPRHLTGPAEASIDITRNEFVLVSTKQHRGTVSCPGREDEYFTATPITRIRMAPRCTARTDTNFATAAWDVSITVPPMAFGWEGDVKALLDNLDLTRFEQLAEEAANRTALPTEIHDIDSWMKENHLDNTVSLSIPILIAGVIFCLIFSGLTVGCYLRRRFDRWLRQHAGSMPSAEAAAGCFPSSSGKVEMRNVAPVPAPRGTQVQQAQQPEQLQAQQPEQLQQAARSPTDTLPAVPEDVCLRPHPYRTPANDSMYLDRNPTGSWMHFGRFSPDSWMRRSFRDERDRSRNSIYRPTTRPIHNEAERRSFLANQTVPKETCRSEQPPPARPASMPPPLYTREPTISFMDDVAAFNKTDGSLQ